MGEKSYVELGNQISEMVRLMRTEKKNLLVKSQEVRPDKMCARSGPKPLPQDYSRSGAAPFAATGLFTCHFVRKIPDVEQHPCCYETGYGSIDT